MSLVCRLLNISSLQISSVTRCGCSTNRSKKLSLFFFFNDPAPTEISPLSLHAALPISGRRFREGTSGRTVRGVDGRNIAWRAQDGHFTARCARDSESSANDSRHAPPARGYPVRDRKSTRLNSSHSQISYAVFCLKKKKK